MGIAVALPADKLARPMPPGLQKSLNFVSGNSALLVTTVCGLLTTRFVISRVGWGALGEITFLLSVTLLINQVGIAGAAEASRYLTQFEAVGEQDQASRYFSNIIFLIVVCSCVIAPCLLAAAWISRGVGRGDLGLLAVFLFATILVTLANTLGVGMFIRDHFYARDGVLILARMCNFLLMAALLFGFGLGVWSVALGFLLGSVVQFIGFSATFAKYLPSVRLDWRLVNRGVVSEVTSFSFFTLVGLCGEYFIRSGTLWAIRVKSGTEMLGKFSPGNQIAQMVAQSIGAILLLAAPAIYRHLARSEERNAVRYLERYMALGVLLAMFLLGLVVSEGRSMLQYWLGATVDDTTLYVVYGCCLSASVMALSSIQGTYLEGINRVWVYGVTTIIEGVLVAVSAWVTLSIGPGRLLIVSLLPGAWSALKQLIIYIAWKNLFPYSARRFWIRNAIALSLFVLVTLCLVIAAHKLVPSPAFVGTLLRSALLTVPLAVFAYVRYFRPRSAGVGLVEASGRIDQE